MAPTYKAPDVFVLPEVISGFLLLHKLGLDRKGCSELLRAAKGLELRILEQVLRSSEAEHFTRGQGGAFAVGPEDDETE